MVVFRDRSTERRRQQQLAVAQRLLRHNLRNELNVVHLLAEQLAEVVGEDQSEVTSELLAGIGNVEGLAEKYRHVEQLLDNENAAMMSLDVVGIITDIVEEVQAAYPDAEIDVDLPPQLDAQTVPGTIELAVRNVLENALEHNTDPAWASVQATKLNDGVEIVVEDDGPGIPEHEQAVVKAGKESALEHGSGIGLWLVKWATTAANGGVFFESTSNGSRVILWYPSN